MEFLIDRKFWNNVIKKADPTMALDIKNGLKKNSNDEIELKKECILRLPNKIIYYGFCDGLINDVSSIYAQYFIKGSLRNSVRNKKAFKKFLALEKIILKLLIEKEGLPPNVKYDVFGEIEYIVEQDQDIKKIEKGFVYLIRNDDIYKIGITDNLLRRFNQLKPDEVLNVVRCSNFENLEKELHKKFKEFRIPQTEYFRLSKNQIEQVNIEMTKGADF